MLWSSHRPSRCVPASWGTPSKSTDVVLEGAERNSVSVSSPRGVASGAIPRKRGPSLPAAPRRSGRTTETVGPVTSNCQDAVTLNLVSS